jgi:hypothetical protein
MCSRSAYMPDIQRRAFAVLSVWSGLYDLGSYKGPYEAENVSLP